MGQKTNPIGFRLGVSKQWNSRYYAGRELPALLREDELLPAHRHWLSRHGFVPPGLLELLGAPGGGAGPPSAG